MNTYMCVYYILYMNNILLVLGFSFVRVYFLRTRYSDLLSTK